MRKQFLVALVIFVATLPLSAKKKGTPEYVLPNRQIEIAFIDFTPAEKDCLNYAWAAAVQSLLRAQQVRMKQSDLVMKASGGDKCYTAIDDYHALMKSLEGDYTPEANRRIKISTRLLNVNDPNTVVGSLLRQRTIVIVRDGRPYLLKGATYDDHYTGDTYTHWYVLRQLRLIDPARAGAAEVVIDFTKEAPADATQAYVPRVGEPYDVVVKELRLGELSSGYSN